MLEEAELKAIAANGFTKMCFFSLLNKYDEHCEQASIYLVIQYFQWRVFASRYTAAI